MVRRMGRGRNEGAGVLPESMSVEDALMLRREGRTSPSPELDIQGSTDRARGIAQALRHHEEWIPIREMEGGSDED